MKVLVSLIASAALFLQISFAHAQAEPGPYVAADKPTASPALAMSPGIYVSAGQGAQTGSQEPRAFAVRIARLTGNATGNEFAGTLEMIRLDRNGELVRQTSELAGVVGQAGLDLTPSALSFSASAPIAARLLGGPLTSFMAEFTGNAVPNGFRLSWKVASKELGYDKIGSGAVFVMATEEEYQQIVTQYTEMSSYKKKLMENEASSSDVLTNLLNNYIQSTDRWLSTPRGSELETIRNKVGTLYAKERKLIAETSSNKAQASVIAMQIDAYYSQSDYVDATMERDDRYQRGSWFSIYEMYPYSACMEGAYSRNIAYGASPSCDPLPALSAVAEKRWHEVEKTLDDLRLHRARVQEALGCLRASAHHLLQPNGGLPVHCETGDLPPD
jgi:hypothetical protein